MKIQKNFLIPQFFRSKKDISSYFYSFGERRFPQHFFPAADKETLKAERANAEKGRYRRRAEIMQTKINLLKGE